jgi:hypothetical protein
MPPVESRQVEHAMCSSRFPRLQDAIMRQLTKHAASFFAITFVCGLVTQTASAQFSSSSRTGSTSGTTMGSSSSTAGTSSTGFGTGATGATGAGTSGLGGGTSGFGSTGTNRTATTGQTPFAPAQLNQNGFIGGRNPQQQQQFIGGNPRTGQNTQQRQQQNPFGNQGRQSRQNPDDNNGMNRQGQNNNQRRAVRPQQKIAFEVPRRTETEVRTTLQTRFDGLTQNAAMRGVTFDMDSDGIVTLRGEVETTSARQLAANLVRLEPGVRKVVNELTVP